MFYLYDNAHPERDADLKKELGTILQKMDDIEIYIEDVNASKKEKKTKERLYNQLLTGQAGLRNGEITDGKTHLNLSPSIEVLMAGAENFSQNIKRIDTGPVFEKEVITEVKEMPELGSELERTSNPEKKQAIIQKIARHIVKRDLRFAEYFEKNVGNPEHSIIATGSSHPLDVLLEKDFKVVRLNEPRLTHHMKEVRDKAARLNS